MPENDGDMKMEKMGRQLGLARKPEKVRLYRENNQKTGSVGLLKNLRLLRRSAPPERISRSSAIRIEITAVAALLRNNVLDVLLPDASGSKNRAAISSLAMVRFQQPHCP